MNAQVVMIYVVCDDILKALEITDDPQSVMSNAETLLAKRGSSIQHRIRPQEEQAKISSRRQIVETAFSCITDLLPRYLRARTNWGFILKVFSAILAYSMGFIES
jgi:hypothetical protein